MARKTSGDVEEGSAVVSSTRVAREDVVDSNREPLIDDVLFSMRQAPYTFQDMRDYMAQEFSEENLDFWAATEEYKQVFEDAKAPKMVRVSPHALNNATEAQGQIVDAYIKPGAPNEVNISSTRRADVLSKADAGEKTKVFDDAQADVRDLMDRDTFPRFLASARTTNLSTDHANWRKRVGYVGIVTALLWAGMAFALEETDIVDTAMLRLPTILFFLIGWGYFLSGRQKV